MINMIKQAGNAWAAGSDNDPANSLRQYGFHQESAAQKMAVRSAEDLAVQRAAAAMTRRSRRSSLPAGRAG